MANRKKSDLLLTATKIANIDLVDDTAPGGRAYKAFMIRAQVLALEQIAAKLEAAE